MINKAILKTCAGEGICQNELYDAYKVFFGTLVSENRLKILNALKSKEKNVSEIMRELDLDQTVVSHDLRRLKLCGFVNTKTNGKFRYYSLNKETIEPLMSLIEKHMTNHCVHIARSLKSKGES